MLKFLFYLFLFYLIFRYLFGGMKIKVFHYNQTQPNYRNPNEENGPQGSVTVDPKVPVKKKETREKLGEYVDFEEVKQD